MGTFGLGGLHRKSTWLYPRSTFAALPSAAVDGSVSVVLDTNTAYQYDAGLPGWIILGGGGGTGDSNAIWRPARVATTGNITLSGEQTIDGVLTSNDRVLVKNQTSADENGIWLSSAGAWIRTSDADTDPEVIGGKLVAVSEGTTQGDTLWQLTTDDPIIVGTTGLAFAQIQGTGSGGNSSSITLGWRGVISDAQTFQALRVIDRTITTDVGFVPTGASTLIGMSIVVNQAHSTNDYTLEAILDPTGRQGPGPVILGAGAATLTLSSGLRIASRRDLSIAIAAGSEIGAYMRRTSGSGSSVPIKSIIVILEYTTP
jgi:hypothetical protein